MEEQKPNEASSPEEYEHGRDRERPGESATPADIGALDGAGSAGAVSKPSDDEGAIPTEAPDPSVGAD
jgi:hypothetical protein